MSSETHLPDSMFEDDALAATQSLEEELLGQGYLMETPLGSSLAAELQSATSPRLNASHMTSLAMETSLSTPLQGSFEALFDINAGVSPLQWSGFTGNYGRSRRSSFSSTWSSLDQDDYDPFEALKKQLEELNSAVWETKTLHKRLLNTLVADEALQTRKPDCESSLSGQKSEPLEIVINSVAEKIKLISSDREKQVKNLEGIDRMIRKEMSGMNLETIKELESMAGHMKLTLHDKQYSYENPLPVMRTLNHETCSVVGTLEELKELMYVNKHQVQELNSRLRSIAKTVHEVRKEIRRINKFIEEKDSDETVVLEKGEVQTRVDEILWGLDDVNRDNTKKLRQMQLFWESQEVVAASAS
ncbi:hypothetical protein CLU79DRAFT_713483 [Phycomyces nitens]|nr:hypothetical protein CLU79DRAFT_713483 [Phycomyces nitens]